ncbi:hypothetical protein [Gaetbulibacter sp. NE]|uniref:hypothetical protein n=1 Tax=Gaetbulibacter sp. NE TaxID=2982307 RepID=UPI0021D26C50|nr:hypothetical protein [Gaetbulibacter sp. NE]
MYYVGQVLYYELNIDYIIETYCINKDKPELQCNGKCHLATQIQKASNDSGKGKSHQMVFEAFYPLFFEAFNEIEFTNKFETTVKNNWSLKNLIDYNFINNLFHPPEIYS